MLLKVLGQLIHHSLKERWSIKPNFLISLLEKNVIWNRKVQSLYSRFWDSLSSSLHSSIEKQLRRMYACLCSLLA